MSKSIKCDCWATCEDYGSHGEVYEIDYCPLHKAAPQMLEALEAMLAEYGTDIEYNNNNDFVEVPSTNEIIVKSRKAIAAATGGDNE